MWSFMLLVGSSLEKTRPKFRGRLAIDPDWESVKRRDTLGSDAECWGSDAEKKECFSRKASEEREKKLTKKSKGAPDLPTFSGAHHSSIFMSLLLGLYSARSDCGWRIY